MPRRVSESGEEICDVCSEVVTIFAQGRCDHVVCYRCSTRMRVLCDQMYCAICRADLPKVLFTKTPGKFAETNTQRFLKNHKYRIWFETEEFESAFYGIQEQSCPRCPDKKPYRIFKDLQSHMRKDHTLFYCDLCVQHLKLFTFERKHYDRKSLAQHRRLGDPDDKSHKGHPLCKFCEERYLDNDELVRHLRKDHYYCHFCDADGISNQFYSDYSLLQDHFRESHQLCEEGDCVNVQFTNAFRNEIDLKAHMTTAHSKSMRKAQARQVRTIEIDFNYGSTRGQHQRRDRDRDRGGVISGADYEEVQQHSRRGGGRNNRRHQNNTFDQDTAAAINASLKDGDTKSYKKTEEDFPTLDGSQAGPAAERKHADVGEDPPRSNSSGVKTTDSMAMRFAKSSNFSVAEGSMEDEDFPSLGGSGKSGNHRMWKTNTSVWTKPTSSDFPTLGQSSKGTKAAAKQPKNTKQSATAQAWTSEYPSSDGSDYPSLSSISKSMAPTGPAPISTFGAGFPNGQRPDPGRSSSGTWKNQGPKKSSSDSRLKADKKDDYPSLSKSTSKQERKMEKGDEYPSLAKSVGKQDAGGPKAKKNDTSAQFKSTEKDAQNVHVKSKQGVKSDNNNQETKQKKKDKQSETKTEKVESKNDDNASAKKTKSKNKNKAKSSKDASKEPNKEEAISNSSEQLEEDSWGASLYMLEPKDQRNEKDRIDSHSSSRDSNKPAKVAPVNAWEEDFPSLDKPSQKLDMGSSNGTSKSDWSVDSMKASKDSMEDYPALGKPQGKVQNSAQDYPALGKPQGKVQNSAQDYPALGKPQGKVQNSAQDYPALGKPQGKVQNSAQDYPALGKPTAKAKQSSKKKNQSVESKISPKEEDFPSLGSLAAVMESIPSWGPISKSEAQPVVPEGSFVTLQGKGKKKKGSGAVYRDVPASWEDSPASGSDNEVTRDDPLASGNKFDVLVQETVVNKVLKEEKASPKRSSKSQLQVNNMAEFPSLGALRDQSNLLTQPPPPVEGLAGISSMVTGSVKPPPPGFSKPKAPPPGFASSKANPPPGFSNTVATPTNDLSADSGRENVAPSPAVSSQPYTQPADFGNRNQQLLGSIQRLTNNDADTFACFKACSTQFRQGSLTAADYYRQCGDVIGQESFMEIFPELLALLPDIEKQQQLLAAHREAKKGSKKAKKGKKSAWGEGDTNFQTCPCCGQVLVQKDASTHISSHNLDADFPSLGSASSNSYGMNAWVKAK